MVLIGVSYGTEDTGAGFDLRQLEYFCAVARTGSFTKAADDLGIAQPSLSEQIARLEEGWAEPCLSS